MIEFSFPPLLSVSFILFHFLLLRDTVPLLKSSSLIPLLIITQTAGKLLNGEHISACHIGTVMQSPCLADDSGGHFHLNETK